MFETMHVLSKAELQARNEVKYETYTKRIQIEARVIGDLAINHILPVAIEYQTRLADAIAKLRGIQANVGDTQSSILKTIETIAERTDAIETLVAELVEARKQANRIEDMHERAVAYYDTVASLLPQIRYHIDKLELVVDDRLWPLPKYRELLFVK